MVPAAAEADLQAKPVTNRDLPSLGTFWDAFSSCGDPSLILYVPQSVFEAKSERSLTYSDCARACAVENVGWV